MSETDLEIASPKALPDEPVPEAEEPKEVEEAPKEEATQEETPTEPAEASEPEEQPDDEDAEKPKPKRRRNLQKRLRQLTQQRVQAERERDQFRQQLEALQTQQAPVEEPKQDDFKSYDDFLVARAEFRARETVRKELETLSTTVQQNQTQADRDARTADWGLKVEEARDKYDDFDEIAQNPDLPVTPEMATAIQDADNGADIAYHLGENPTLAREIAALPPIRAVMRIGQISDQLSKPPSPKPTAAPKPPVQVQGGGVAPQKDPSKMSYPEYVKWRKGE